jgi:hypothetical protein
MSGPSLALDNRGLASVIPTESADLFLAYDDLGEILTRLKAYGDALDDPRHAVSAPVTEAANAVEKAMKGLLPFIADAVLKERA